MLGDLTGSTSVGKKEDTYSAKNEKTSELWRPGANFKPTYFNEAKGPKVRPSINTQGKLDGVARCPSINLHSFSPL